MKPLSPHYRNDSPDALDESVRVYLDEHYLKHLPNLDKENPKLLVVFSGGNAVGKTTLSRKIEKEFGGIVLENDEIKRNLIKFDPTLWYPEINPVTWAYSLYLYKHLADVTKNGLIIRDGVIHWYFDRILPIFKAQGYELFIIDFDLSKEKQTELLLKRGDTETTTAKRLLTLFKDHEIHRARFLKEYVPDVTLTDETIFNDNLVIDALRRKIQLVV